MGFCPLLPAKLGGPAVVEERHGAGAGVGRNSAGEERKVPAAVSQLSVTLLLRCLAFGVHKAPVALASPLRLLVFACSPHQPSVLVLLIQVSWPVGVGTARPVQWESGCTAALAHADTARGRGASRRSSDPL